MNPTDNAAKSSPNRKTVPPQSAPRSHTETVLPSQQDSVPSVGGLHSKLGQEFGRYQILECLGQGAMGEVYKARDQQLDRIVALKIPKFSAQAEPGLLERFYREARSAATLSHPNICPVYDVGEHEGVHYISMGFIDGNPLSAFIRPDKPQPERKVSSVVRKLAAALEEAHRRGIVHRDLKPENVMIDNRGQPIIMDFGLAQQTDTTGDIRTTQGGQMIGTPAYMSPERVDGDLEHIGPASDVYSLGVILYELLTGVLPYDGSVASVLAQIIQGEPKPPSQRRTGLDPALEAICLKMMAADRDQRYQTMAEVTEALSSWIKGESSATAPSQSPQEAADDELAALFDVVDSETKASRISVAPSKSSHPSGNRGTRKPSARAQDTPWFKQTRIQLAGGGLAALLVLLGVVLFVRVGDQTVKIEIDDPKAQVFIDGENITIKNLGATVELKPGKHNLDIRRGDVVVQSDKFEVVNGDNPVLKIQVVKPQEEKPMIALNDAGQIPLVADAPTPMPSAGSNTKPTTDKSESPMTASTVTPTNVSNPGNSPTENTVPQRAPNNTPEKNITTNSDDVKSIEQEVIRWVFGQEGYVGLSVPSKNLSTSAFSPERLPKAEYVLTGVHLHKGGQVTVADMERIAKLPKITTIRMPNCGLTDKHLAPLAKIEGLLSLGVADNPITGAGLAQLKDCTRLYNLNLTGTNITDNGLECLKEFPRLGTLDLSDTKISDDAIDSVIKSLPITNLELNKTKVTDQAVLRLREIPRLYSLSLNGTDITDAGLETLSGLENLRTLRVENTKITDEGLSHLSEIPHLTDLTITGCKVTERGIKEHIVPLKNLRYVRLANTPLTDDGLLAFGKAPGRLTLICAATKITREGIDKLKEANPQIRVLHGASYHYVKIPLAENRNGQPRFLDKGEYVEDTATGFLWQKDGNDSGKLNYYQAAQYAKQLKLGQLSGWRVPSSAELATIFPATEKPFVDSGYSEGRGQQGPQNSFWTSELDLRGNDSAYVFQWYGDGGANNCIASANFVYVRCIHDPIQKK